MKFNIQMLTDDSIIWYTPRPYDIAEGITTSDTISELRDVIANVANTTTWPWWRHYRIITEHGRAVERWKVKPGRAVKTRSNY